MLIPELNINQDFRKILEDVFYKDEKCILKLNTRNSVIEFGFCINRK